MSKTLKKYLISSLITFVAAFCIAILPFIDDLTVQSVQEGALVSLLFTGLRASFKAVIEGFIAWYSTK